MNANKYDRDSIKEYLRDLENYGSLSASMDADIKATGNITDNEKLSTSGFIALNDVHLGKTKGDDYFSFNRMALSIIKLNPKNFEYNYDSIILTEPFLKYEKYDQLDNIQRMFGIGGAEIKNVNADRSFRFNLIIEIADYVKVISRNFFISNYKVGRAALLNGNFQFNNF